MKKKLAKLLVFTLLLALLPMGTAQAAESRTMRIGLTYGSAAVPAAELRNAESAGFRFGFYDETLQFIPLGWTEESDIQVLITQNLFLSDGGYGYSAENSQGIVGCYHVHLPWPYEDFLSAQAAAALVEGGFVAWVGGAYYVRMGSYPSRAEAEAAAAATGVEGCSLGETSGYGYSVVAGGTTKLLFQYDADAAGEAGAFGVVPGLEGAGVTLYADNKYRGGLRFERIGGGNSTVVNIVDLEDYVKGVIPYEMSASWPLEALKAQSVCARAYAINHSGGRATHKDSHFDLCTTTHCQVYRGIGRANEHSDQAVNETAGQLAWYNGKLIDAVYYSSNGGASEDVKRVWGSNHDYLKGKLDPYEADIADIAGNYHWSVTRTAAELKTRFNKAGYACGDIVSITPKLSEVGNVVQLVILDTAGKSYTISRADTIRTTLGTNSIRFTMTTSGGAGQEPGYMVAGAGANVPTLDGLYALGGDGTVSALPTESYIITADGVKPLEPMEGVPAGGSGETSYTFTGTGWGHNVGMSQWGAYAMAERGFTYQDILKFYYTDITVE